MKENEADANPGKVWRKTRIQGLLQHRNGTYYARSFGGKKEKWKSLKTTVFSIAEIRHREQKKELRDQQTLESTAESKGFTFKAATAIYLARLKADPERKTSTKHYQEQVLKSIHRDWPELDQKPLARITRNDFAEWSTKHAKRASATRYNAAIGILRAIMEIGVTSGIIVSNPAQSLKRRSIRSKKPELPDRGDFLKMLEEMRRAAGRFSTACADFVAGLAYTGVRLNEANHLCWKDVDFKRRIIHVRGDAETGTKNWETREVPMIPDARALFERLFQSAGDEPDRDASVFSVREAQKSLDRAAKKVGTARITHHDLRHLFATICIESGVDIPTVSRWLGHKDGGALAMKTYGHLRNEHSLAQAQKVSFAVLQEQVARYGEMQTAS